MFILKYGFHYRCVGDEGRSEHLRWNPNCLFLKGVNVANVPLNEVTIEHGDLQGSLLLCISLFTYFFLISKVLLVCIILILQETHT
jgi:hypothetical protein